MSGGALYAVTTEITLPGIVQFHNNSARNGGALYLEKLSSIIMTKPSLTAANNKACEYGGVMFHKDIPTPTQCEYPGEEEINKFFPKCFISLSSSGKNKNFKLHFKLSNNTAEKGGDFLYGGLLDRCWMKKHSNLPYVWMLEVIDSSKKGENDVHVLA